ncbi:unnamed protein product [Blepharisma stoltei]|uniref:Uncharacterized protein n=1 Tax=Blepharisma stoltei TaxID=1481888 RepID=A0AAU9J5X0_9CILI|nr:unnamed protein product [Blepharisma stoltei]
MDFQDRLSGTPLYAHESLEELYQNIDQEVLKTSMEAGSSKSYSQAGQRTKKSVRPGIRTLQSKYLSKRHRFFKAAVREECVEQALEIIEHKLKELVEQYNGDLHVCKVSGNSDITAYFIVNDEVTSNIWAKELEDVIAGYLKPGTKPSLLEMMNLKE